MPECALERVVGQLGDLTGHLDTGGSGPDDDERQQLLPAGRVTGALGLLERAEDATAQLQRIVDGLHAGGELGEMVVAEVGLSGTGGDDQAVERGHVRVPEQFGAHGLGFEVDARHVTEQHLGVPLVAQDHPRGRCDLAFGDDPRGHLVQQRLEQVMSGSGDQLDVDVGLLELLGRRQTAETGSDDDDLVPIGGRSSGMAHCCSSRTCERQSNQDV